MSILNGKHRNTDRTYRSFGKSLDFDGKITKVIQLCDMFTVSIACEVLNTVNVFIKNFLTRTVEEVFVELLDKILFNEVLQSEYY